MEDLLKALKGLLVAYPYILYILLFLCVAWLIYTIISVIKQMDFGHGITDIYDKNGKKRKPKEIKVKFTWPILSVCACIALILFIL